MSETPDELWRDVAIVLKHIRFIAALLAGALLVAVITGLATGSDNKATSEAQITVTAAPRLSGGIDTVPTLETFETLAKSDAVAEAAAQQLRLQQAEVKSEIRSVTANGDPLNPKNPATVSIVTGGASQAQAEAIGAAVIEAFAAAAQDTQVDAEALDALRKQEELARQRLESGQEEMFELAQIQTDLGTQRRLLSALDTNLRVTNQALDLLDAERSRPLAELMVALSGVLDLAGTVAIESASSVQELERGLLLRRQLIERSIEETKVEVDTLAEREQQLRAATAEVSAIEALLTTAVQNLQATDLAAQLAQTDVTITEMGVDSSSGVNWLARLGAAAAFGLVAGVAGAFGLEFLAPQWRRWRGEAPFVAKKGPGGKDTGA